MTKKDWLDFRRNTKLKADDFVIIKTHWNFGRRHLHQQVKEKRGKIEYFTADAIVINRDRRIRYKSIDTIELA